MYPSGRPGIALVILRVCSVSMLLLHACRYGPIVSLTWPMPVLLLVASALCAGIGTTIACIMYCAVEIGFALTATGFDASVLILSIPVAIALALLGPGAYSLDARVFGRRVIVISR
jgi:hypothetical protein